MSLWDASLETANRWYDISWYGLLISGVIAALAAGATVTFLFLQFWSTGVRDRHAELRTTALEAQTEQARADSARANAEAAKANAEAAKANEAAAQAQLSLEKERLERLKIEEKLAPRSLSQEQQSSFRGKVRQFAGAKIDILVFVEGSSQDTLPFAQLVATTLASAGWVVRFWTTMGGTAHVTGILVSTMAGADPATEQAANSVVAALNSERIAAGRWEHYADGAMPQGLSGISGPPWDAAKVAPIRMLIGTKS